MDVGLINDCCQGMAVGFGLRAFHGSVLATIRCEAFQTLVTGAGTSGFTYRPRQQRISIDIFIISIEILSWFWRGQIIARHHRATKFLTASPRVHA